jgi:hypothetical protein
MVPHGEYPSSQLNPQRLAVHDGSPCSGAVQVAPQPPQFFASSFVKTQPEPHTVSPLRHDSVAWQVLVPTSQV